MDCKSVQNLLEDYLDGALAEQTRAGLELHVQNCEVCQAELDVARSLRSALSRGCRVVAPADFTRNVLLALERQEAKKSHRRAVAATVFSACVAAGLFAILILYLNSLGLLRSGFSSEAVAAYSQDVVARGKSVLSDLAPSFKLTPEVISRVTVGLISLLFTFLLLAISNLIYNYRQLKL